MLNTGTVRALHTVLGSYVPNYASAVGIKDEVVETLWVSS
jgi:hypothetical protein